MLTIYRRHLKGCKQRSKGRAYRRCKCPIWVDGSLDGHEMRKSLDTRDWQKASDQIHEWESRGTIKDTEKAAPITIEHATAEFIRDAHGQKLASDTVYKYRLLFRRLKAFADRAGIRYLSELDLATLRDFRAEWPENALTCYVKLKRLRRFLRFCVDSNWIAVNHALKITPPRVDDPPTLPLTRDEVGKIVNACYDYPDKLNRVRLRALVLLMRYSGLRISDAVTLAKDRIQDDKLLLKTMKTGVIVWLPLPPSVIDSLSAIPSSGRYFFWTGGSTPKNCAGVYQRALRRLFKQAGTPTAHPHRLRDTFAVEALLSGIPIERVSILLGHASIRTTEKHYSPWVRARQEQLEADVRRTWETDLIATKGTPEVHGKSSRPN